MASDPPSLLGASFSPAALCLGEGGRKRGKRSRKKRRKHPLKQRNVAPLSHYTVQTYMIVKPSASEMERERERRSSLMKEEKREDSTRKNSQFHHRHIFDSEIRQITSTGKGEEKKGRRNKGGKKRTARRLARFLNFFWGGGKKGRNKKCSSVRRGRRPDPLPRASILH